MSVYSLVGPCMNFILRTLSILQQLNSLFSMLEPLKVATCNEYFRFDVKTCWSQYMFSPPVATIQRYNTLVSLMMMLLASVSPQSGLVNTTDIYLEPTCIVFLKLMAL